MPTPLVPSELELVACLKPERIYAHVADLAAMARQVLAGMQPTPGGDAYVYTGSMRAIEQLRDVVEEWQTTLTALGLDRRRFPGNRGAFRPRPGTSPRGPPAARQRSGDTPD